MKGPDGRKCALSSTSAPTMKGMANNPFAMRVTVIWAGLSAVSVSSSDMQKICAYCVVLARQFCKTRRHAELVSASYEIQKQVRDDEFFESQRASATSASAINVAMISATGSSLLTMPTD